MEYFAQPYFMSHQQDSSSRAVMSKNGKSYKTDTVFKKNSWEEKKRINQEKWETKPMNNVK